MINDKTAYSPLIYLTDEQYEIINNSHNVFARDGTMNVGLIKTILEDNYFFKVVDFFNNEIDRLLILYRNNGRVEIVETLKKVDTVYAISNYFRECLLLKKGINPEEKNKYEKLKELISLDNLKNKYNNYIYDITIDNINYHVPVNEMLLFLENANFKDIIDNRHINEINGIRKDHFAYLIRSFFADEKIFTNYLVSCNIENNYNYMLEKMDLEAINQFTITTDQLYKEIRVDKDLEEAIISSIPKDLSKLEQALFIYIKMCKIFNYDEKYYVFNQEGECNVKHRNINYVTNINLQNRELVCFEFNIIYCYFLNKLNINFKSNYIKSKNENYGKCHVNVDYRCDKFLVEADSLLSIIFSDLYLAKINKRLKGIKCLNRNSETQREFEIILNNVYQRIYDQEDKILNVSNYGVIEKLKYLYRKISQNNFSNMDYVSYFVDLYNNIFSQDEKENDIKISLVRNNDKVNIVIALNLKYSDCVNQNAYYVLVPNKELLPISYISLQEMFNDGIIEYINKDRGEIPGIIVKNEMLKTFVKSF